VKCCPGADGFGDELVHVLGLVRNRVDFAETRAFPLCGDFAGGRGRVEPFGVQRGEEGVGVGIHDEVVLLLLASELVGLRGDVLAKLAVGVGNKRRAFTSALVDLLVLTDGFHGVFLHRGGRGEDGASLTDGGVEPRSIFGFELSRKEKSSRRQIFSP